MPYLDDETTKDSLARAGWVEIASGDDGFDFFDPKFAICQDIQFLLSDIVDTGAEVDWSPISTIVELDGDPFPDPDYVSLADLFERMDIFLVMKEGWDGDAPGLSGTMHYLFVQKDELQGAVDALGSLKSQLQKIISTISEAR